MRSQREDENAKSPKSHPFTQARGPCDVARMNEDAIEERDWMADWPLLSLEVLN